MECYSATEKNEMMPFTAAWMQLEIISELETDRQISYDITYMWYLLIKWYKWTYLQNGYRLVDIENQFMVTKGESGR